MLRVVLVQIAAASASKTPRNPTITTMGLISGLP